MSSIDLVILGMVLEEPRSAYAIQKDVAYHHLSRWTKISTPSVYKKVLQLQRQGYLESTLVRGDRFGEKAVYSVTEQGKAYFHQQMAACAAEHIPLQFDFNVVITNLNKVDKSEGLALLNSLQSSLDASAQACAAYAEEFSDIPLVGRSIFDQQLLLYRALQDWLAGFKAAYKDSEG